MTTSRRRPGAYLIHFDQPLRHARHYLGAAEDIPSRLADHWAGNGAKIMAAVDRAGITWKLARTWPTRSFRAAIGVEIALKNRRDSPRLCPICSPGTRRGRDPKPAYTRTARRHPPRSRPAPDRPAPWALTGLADVDV
jgi:predicted GIY-YIG superfamily endonuclease